ncbi:MAG: AAA-like domain-containing protein [Leptolyngbyaceae cyanobacterium]
MNDLGVSEKRRRGVLLSFQGWQRLQSAEQLVAVQRNGGNPFTLEQLSEATGLSPNTLTKVRRRQKPVDFATLDTYFGAFDLALEPTDLVTPEVHVRASNQFFSQQNQPPRGPLSLGSPFYVYRPPLERLCFQEILNPGSLVRIKAPRQYGKTSLLTQILGYAQDQGLQAAVVNLQLAEGQVLEGSDAFLRWFCASVARAIDLPNELKTRWEPMFGAAYSCTDYFETYLLPSCDRPLLVMIDGLDELFARSDVTTDFCGLLRAWYEQGRYGLKQEIWQRLRLVVAHSMEVLLPLNLHQSPFNVGVPVELPGFDLYQTQEIASRYELDFSETDAYQLLNLLGGHPYLTQLSMFYLSQGSDIKTLTDSASALDSVFSSHSRRQLELLEAQPDALSAMTEVAKSPAGAKLYPSHAYYLQGLGLVRFEAQQTVPSCELYRQYFGTVLEA